MDGAPHQIVSFDCRELSSPVIQAGGEWTVLVGAGPATCHFSDLLNPDASAFSGPLFIIDFNPEGQSGI